MNRSPDGLETSSAIERSPQIDLAESLLAVRVAFSHAIASLPPSRSALRQLMESLGLTRTLAWRVIRVSQAEDAGTVAEFLPGPEGVEIFLQKAAIAGMDPLLIQRIRETTKDFYAMVGRHASSRPALRRLASGMVQQDRAKTELKFRKQAMEANCQIWGVQVATQFNLAIVCDKPVGGRVKGSESRSRSTGQGGRADLVVIRGMHELMRVHSEVAWRFMHSFTQKATDFASPCDPLATPLFPDQVVKGVPFMGAFCSQPMPEIRRLDATDFSTQFELLPGPVGRTGSSTLFVGEILRRFVYRKAEPGVSQFVHLTRMRTPAKLVVAELMVERSLFGVIEPDVALHDLMSHSGPFQGTQSEQPERMQSAFVFERLGAVDQAPPVASVPRYSAMSQAIFEQIGRDQRDFDLWRVVLEYPPIPTMLTMTVNLPA